MNSCARLLLPALVLIACGTPQALPPLLPENVAVEPRGIVGVISVPATATLATALRAIGVPHRVLPVNAIDDNQLGGLSVVMVDERAFDDVDVPIALPRVFDHARASGIPVVVFAQNPETSVDAIRSSAAPFVLRVVGYDVDLVATQREHRVLTYPNTVGLQDLEAFSPGTRQLARGRNARAIIAGNADRPDSSAALLRAAYGKGSIWYVAFEIIQAAADGHPSAQRLLGNIASLRTGD